MGLMLDLRGCSSLHDWPATCNTKVMVWRVVYFGSGLEQGSHGRSSCLATGTDRAWAARWNGKPQGSMQKCSSERGHAMRCANPKCNAAMMEAAGGTMTMLELELPPEARIERSEWGFPILCVPAKYFWLCEECSRLYLIRRWTTAGLLLHPRLAEVSKPEVIRTVSRKPPVGSHGARHDTEIARIA